MNWVGLPCSKIRERADVGGQAVSGFQIILLDTFLSIGLSERTKGKGLRGEI